MPKLQTTACQSHIQMLAPPSETTSGLACFRLLSKYLKYLSSLSRTAPKGSIFLCHKTQPSDLNMISINSSSKKSKTGATFSVLTSPSVDSSCRSLRLLTLSGPLAALTSTPRGASMVSVLVGDSSLSGENTHTCQEPELSSAASELSSRLFVLLDHHQGAADFITVCFI